MPNQFFAPAFWFLSNSTMKPRNGVFDLQIHCKFHVSMVGETALDARCYWWFRKATAPHSVTVAENQFIPCRNASFPSRLSSRPTHAGRLAANLHIT